MNINDFKIGDRVKIINALCGDRSCSGKVGVITEERANIGLFNYNEGINIKINDKEIWRVGRLACLELLPEYPSIHITTNGKETYAILKEDGKVIKKSIAKCSPYDEFNFEDGVKIAVDRLFEEKKEDNFSVVFGKDYGGFIKSGKIYDFKDGYTIWDDERKSAKHDNFNDFKRYNPSLQPYEIKKANRIAKDGEYVQIVGGIKSTNKEGKTTQSGEVCIKSSDAYNGYEWFKNINNNMEILLTNIHTDTPEVVKLIKYDEKTIDEIIENIDLLKYAEQSLDFEQDGKNYFTNCPLHIDLTPSLSITPRKNLFYCFSCGIGGTIIGWLMKIEGLTYEKAVIKASSLANIDLSKMCQSQTVKFLRKYSKQTKKETLNKREILDKSILNQYTKYVVLEGYEKYIEYIEEKKKAEFKPYLVSNIFDTFYGNMGEKSSQVDILENRLKIGDTVNIYCDKEFVGERSVVLDDKTDFIMGLEVMVFSNGRCDDWAIIKKRSYKDVKDKEVVDSIKYVKSDPSKS